MPTSPEVFVFDVNETLSDMSGMARRFTAVGAPPEKAELWFASVLRDGFALATAGENADFGRLARENLADVLAGGHHDRPLDDAVDSVMAGFAELDVHPDVTDGLHALAAAGGRLVTLSNGATAVAEGLLTRAGVRQLFEALLSVEGADRWKPAPEAYAYALQACGVEAQGAMLVAVHPWDVDGAARVGMRTAWVNRAGRRYPSAFRAPDVTVDSVRSLAAALLD